MAKNTASADLSHLDQRISELTQQVRERFTALKQEVSAQQKEMERLSEQHERLTGKTLLSVMLGSQGAKPGPKATGGKGGRKGKRTRKPSPDIAWLQETLGKGGKTIKQLQEAAEEAGLSGIRIPAILKEAKGKFKSEAGTKAANVKGKAAAVWGVK